MYDAAVPERSLASVDLNLLVALDALLTERSVTKAAKRLRLSQPATSRALSRLRALLGDELLVRDRQGLALTPRAEALAAPVRSVLEAAARVLEEGAAFDPARANRTFRVLMTDHGMLAIVPALVARLAKEAPHVDLELAAPRPEPELALVDGEVDLFVGAMIADTAGIYSQKLFDESLVCIVRKGHPAARQRLTLAKFASLSHGLVSPRGRGPALVDRVLAEHGLTRRIAVRLPSFTVAPLVVARTDLVLTVPTRVVRAFEGFADIRVVDAPIELPSFAVHQVWHERSHRDPAHGWLREQVRACV